MIDHLEAGYRVRRAREKAGKSLRWLAHQMGYSPAFMSDLELGRRNWKQDSYDKAMSVIKEG